MMITKARYDILILYCRNLGNEEVDDGLCN